MSLRFKTLLIILSLTLITKNFCQAQDYKKEEKIIELLKNHKFKALRKQFDSDLKNAVSTKQMKKIWNGLEMQFGKYKSHGTTHDDGGDENEKTITQLFFEKGSLNLSTTFNTQGLLIGIFLKPNNYHLPVYGKNLVYNLEPVTISSGKYQLPGEIMYPKNLSQKVPLVIFVHGSGANNRYEGFGTVMVFKDFALGLISKGIACMLYDKRTLIYKSEYDTAQYTIWEETVEDAVNAFKLAKTKQDIDTNQIFIIGHSLGGYALPYILKYCNGIKGGISLAGASRPMDVVISDQYQYLIKLDGKVSLAEKVFLRKETKKIKAVRDNKICTSKPKTKLLAYWPSKFWCDIKNYDPVQSLREQDIPVLFLQGERDYQVTDKDFSRWKSAYLEKKDWSFISYPKLNHLFFEGEGPANPSEYFLGGNVPVYVIEDLAGWVNRK